MSNNDHLVDREVESIRDGIKKIQVKVGKPYEGRISHQEGDLHVVVNVPIGMTIGLYTGTIRWTPTPDQAEEDQAEENQAEENQAEKNKATFKTNNIERTIQFIVKENEEFQFEEYGQITVGWVSNQGTLKGTGDYNNETKEIDYARQFRSFRTSKTNEFSRKRIIYLRGGSYPFIEDEAPLDTDTLISGFQNIKIWGTEDSPVIIKPWGNERPKIRGNQGAIMRFTKADYLTIEGLELKGESNSFEYNPEEQQYPEKIIKDWWKGSEHLNGNGFAIAGRNVTVKDCVVHEVMGQAIAFQKATNITCENNIVANSARWTIKGTTAIGFVRCIGLDDDSETPQFNIMRGNLIYGVESRIFSHVFAKGHTHLTIDEGEGLLVQSFILDAEEKPYKGRYSLENNCLMWCGKGIVVNRADRVDVLNCTIYNCGTTISGSGKGLRGNKSSDCNWKRNLVATCKGASGDYGYGVSLFKPESVSPPWETGKTYNPDNIFSFTPTSDGFLTKDGVELEKDTKHFLQYSDERKAEDLPETFTLEECKLCIEFVPPILENNYVIKGSENNDDTKETEIVYLEKVFEYLDGNDPTPSQNIQDLPENIGADADHHIQLLDRGRSYSVNVTPDKYGETMDYGQQTEDIIGLIPSGLQVHKDYWQDTLPYTDQEGKKQKSFKLPLTGQLDPLVYPEDDKTQSLIDLEKKLGESKDDTFYLSVVHPYKDNEDSE